MGYLDNDTIVVDAILTKHGRELLSEGQAINPSHFALSDDGVDYTLWNTSSPSGSAGYDDYISKLPMIEAVPTDEVQMRYTLFTAEQNTRYLPTVAIQNCPTPACRFTLNNATIGGDSVRLAATITNYAGSGNDRYTFTCHNYVGLDVVQTDCSGPSKISGHRSVPYEQNSPITVKFTGGTYIEFTDETVTADTVCSITVEHEPTGVVTNGSVLVKKA